MKNPVAIGAQGIFPEITAVSKFDRGIGNGLSIDIHHLAVQIDIAGESGHGDQARRHHCKYHNGVGEQATFQVKPPTRWPVDHQEDYRVQREAKQPGRHDCVDEDADANNRCGTREIGPDDIGQYSVEQELQDDGDKEGFAARAAELVPADRGGDCQEYGRQDNRNTE